MGKFILSLDQGTTSSRAIVFDENACARSVHQKEFEQIFPASGMVEHRPGDIWSSQYEVMMEAMADVGVGNIAAIGITNQRETTIVWDALTGEPVYNAIVWQDRRTSAYCNALGEDVREMVAEKTGLHVDPYFSATKIRWILENVPLARERAEAGRLRFGTVDSFLVWKLTGGKVHVTDVSNASRTMLFNIYSLEWDSELLDLFGIPESMLPQVRPNSFIYGYAEVCGTKIPVASMIGDQQAALFGQLCVNPGDVKNTYGTGCFLLMNTGNVPVRSSNNLLTSVAWMLDSQVNYVLEGSVFVAGATVQWLRDGLGIIRESSQVEPLAASVADSGGVYFVPALTGLGAPYWNSDARGVICGISRGTTSAHIARAALEGIAFEVADVVEAMENDVRRKCESLKVDGGASRNNLLMQIQADILGAEVVRPLCHETTALGAAFMAGLAVGFWKDVTQLGLLCRKDRSFQRSIATEEAAARLENWHEAVRKA